MHTPHWYLILTKPRCEQQAKAELEQQNYTTYLPLIHSIIPKPLLPRYIFVAADASQDIHPIDSTKGVVKIIRFGTTIARVRDEVLTELKARESLITKQLEQEKILKSGDKVTITDGVFKGYNAIFKEPNGDKRVILFFNIMHTEQHLILDKESIIKLT